MNTIWNDMRFGLRQLRKSPGFTAVAVLTLALGIGASTAMFSIVNTFILNPVPLAGGNRLVEINEIDQAHNRMYRVSVPLYHDLQSHPEIFEKMASFTYDGIDAAGDEFAERLFGCRVTPSFFEIFNIQPTLGRVFQKQEGSPANDNVVIISHSLWQRRFGGDVNIIGRKLETSDRTFTIKTFTIVGVMPSHFQFPSQKTLYWRPFHFTSKELTDPVQRQMSNWWVIARLKASVSCQKAQVFLDALNQRLALDYPGTRQTQIIRVRPLRDFFVDPELQKTLWALMGAIGFILLIACANLANLQMARTESRLHEVSVRMALGAERRHIVRQLLIESLFLSLLGGLGGVLVSFWGVKILSLMVPNWSPLVRLVAVDKTVLLCALILSIATGITFGLFPAWYASRIRISESLKETGSLISAGLGQKFFRNALVVGEVALAFVLLVGAALMIQSVVHMLQVNPGYDPTNLTRINISMRYGRVTSEDFEQRRNQFPALAECFAALSGTMAVGFMGDSYAWRDWQVEGVEEPVTLRLARVGVGNHSLFRAIRVPLREGRLFEHADTTEGQTSIVVNESLARLCWPGGSAVGKSIRWGRGVNTTMRTVVGVVGDHKEWGYDRGIEPTVYEPFEREPQGSVYFLLRTSLDPASLIQAARRDIKEILPNTYAPSIDWLEQILWASTYSRRLYTYYLCAFGGAGLCLSALGIVGVLAYSVSCRTREIGIRIALGAQKHQVVGLIISEGMRLVFFGAALGVLGALTLTWTLENQLFGVRAIDPVSIGAGTCVLVAIGLLACFVPAHRATKIDPMETLRYE